MNCRERERAERAEMELRTAHEMRKALADKVTAQQAVQQCRIRALEDQVEKRETARCARPELERHIEVMAEADGTNEHSGVGTRVVSGVGL